MEQVNMNPKTQKKLDTYKLRVFITHYFIKPGDFMFTEGIVDYGDYVNYPKLVYERAIFQVISLNPNGSLKLRFIHFKSFFEPVSYARRILDTNQTMNIGTDIGLSMNKNGMYYLQCNHGFSLQHVSLEKIKSTSLLSYIPKHPLLDPKLFDKLIKLSAIDYIMRR